METSSVIVFMSGVSCLCSLDLCRGSPSEVLLAAVEGFETRLQKGADSKHGCYTRLVGGVNVYSGVWDLSEDRSRIWDKQRKKTIVCAAMLCHKCSTEIQTEDSSSSEHLGACFFLPTLMP